MFLFVSTTTSAKITKVLTLQRHETTILQFAVCSVLSGRLKDACVACRGFYDRVNSVFQMSMKFKFSYSWDK